MKAGRLAALALIVGLGLSSGSGTSGEGTVLKRDGEPDVITVNDEDPDMTRAMETARRTLDEFVRRLDAPPPSQTSLSLKARFEENGSIEHIWLSEVARHGEAFTGRIANDPVDIPSVRAGQRVTVPRERVSDWMAVDGGRLVGGYTVRVLYDRASPEQKADLDQQFRMSD